MRKLVLFCVCLTILTVQSCTKQELNDDAVQVDKDKIIRPGDQPSNP